MSASSSAPPRRIPEFLSKSRLVSYRQCARRVWLEVHRPELREDSASSQAIFAAGHQVGEIAQRLYDDRGDGAFVDLHELGPMGAIARTRELLAERRPIFEAGFAAAGAMAFADLLLPVERGWRMVEVKSSTSVKDYYLDDVAIQSYVARGAGLSLESVAVAHIDSGWTYPGGGDYRGLLTEVDCTAEAAKRADAVRDWVANASAIVRRPEAPEIAMGRQCREPFACGFAGHCGQGVQAPPFPIAWLPRVQAKELLEFIDREAATDMRAIPAELLTDVQRRVRECTVSGQTYFDREGARADVGEPGWPAWFLDFETVRFAVPVWAGTRPFQQIPFQFSLHRVDEGGGLHHTMFLDLEGTDPSLRLAEALVAHAGDHGPVYAYNAGFEGACIRALAERYPPLRDRLLRIAARLVDLLPIAQRRYYHPRQQGSWSIKKVYPAIAGAGGYEQLGEVQDGDAAGRAYLEAIASQTTGERRELLRRELEAYCGLDTLALVRVWESFSGRERR